MKKYLITLFTALMVISHSYFFVSALENDMPPLVKDKNGSLNVNTFEGSKPVSGFEFTVYKVADIEVQPSGTVLYKPVSEFDIPEAKYDGMTVEESQTAAEKMAVIAEKLTGTSAISDDLGVAEFTDLKPGMYLVVNTSRTKMAVAYHTIKPFLISVPYPVKSDSGNYWEYEVSADPKTSISRIPLPPYVPPVTGVE